MLQNDTKEVFLATYLKPTSLTSRLAVNPNLVSLVNLVRNASDPVNVRSC